VAREQFVVEHGGATLVGDRWRAADAPGQPTAVFLHAGVCDRRSWHGVCELLHQDAVAYDRRDYGESTTGSQPFTHLDDLLAVLDRQVGAPAWLVGNSIGGGLALDAATARPSAVAGLVLIAPAVSGGPWIDSDDVDPDTRRIEAAIEAAEASGDREAVNRLEIRLWLDGPGAPEGRVGGAARQLALDMNAGALASDLPEGAGESGVSAWGGLGEITAPITVAWGDLDLPAIVEHCRALLERVPRAARHVFAGMAHLPSLESPEAVADLVRGAVTSGDPAT